MTVKTDAKSTIASICITVIIILLWAGFTSDYVERVKLEWEKNEHDQNTSVTNNGGNDYV